MFGNPGGRDTSGADWLLPFPSFLIPWSNRVPALDTALDPTGASAPEMRFFPLTFLAILEVQRSPFLSGKRL